MKIGLWFTLLTLATVGLYFAPPSWQAQRMDVLIQPQDEPTRLVWSLTPEAKLDLAEENPVLLLRARRQMVLARPDDLYPGTGAGPHICRR